MHPALSRLTISLVILATLAVSPALGRQPFATIAGAAAGIGFGATTVVDDQRTGGEPDIKECGPTATWSYGNCGLDNPYASIPWGFSTTSSYIWRSEDDGQTFKLVPSNSTVVGKPDACPGGGDTDLTVSPGSSQSTDFLAFADLQGLTNFSTGTSSNGGQSWFCNPISSFATAVDRQWFGAYGNLAGAPSNGSVLYMDYDIAEGGITPGCAGNEFVVQRSTDGGKTFSPETLVDCNDGISGNIQVNQKNGHVYAIHTAYTDTTNSVAADAVRVEVSSDGGNTWTTHTVYGCTPTVSNGSTTADCTTGQDFAVVAIDKSGTLYALWSQAPTDGSANITGPSHIYYSYSTNEGSTWSAPYQVDQGASTNVDLFPWITAGNAGAVDVVWYGTTAANSSVWDPGSQQSNWYPYLSQSLNANTATPTFTTPLAVAQHSNHYGGICTMGIGCTTGGDRSLADFFQVDIDKAGGAQVIWADTSNNGASDASGNAGALIDEARQISGPTLFGTSLKGSAPTCNAVNKNPCVTDIKGDAKYEANGIIDPNVPKLDITGSSVNVYGADPSKLDVRLQVANLSSLPNPSDSNIVDPYVEYLTSWNYHIPGDTDANFDSTGNVYYAYLEVQKATGTVDAVYDGDTCSIDSTKPKDLVYPGQHQITYSINNSNGTIDLYVPRADIGNPPKGTPLYSVTGHTLGEAAPAHGTDADASCPRTPNGNNFDPSGQLFNVYDKSSAYTSILNN